MQVLVGGTLATAEISTDAWQYPAIKTKLADVKLVTVWDRLDGLVADVRVPRGKEVPDARDGDRRDEDAHDGDDDRELVPPCGKNLGHS